MKHYYDEYIKAVNPKIIISLSDTTIFIAGKTQMIQKIIIQRAFRTCLPTDMLSNLKSLKRNKSTFNCDYLLKLIKKGKDL